MVAGNGQWGYNGDGELATSAELKNPIGVAVDSAGNIYIADSYNDRVRKVMVGSHTISTIAGNGYNSSNYSGGYSGDGGPAVYAELFWPQGVALDSAGDVYIADYYNNAIREVTASTGTITTVIGNGAGAAKYECNGDRGDGGPANSARLCWPGGVETDGVGNIYVADSNNYRIRKVIPSALPPTAQTATPLVSVTGGTYGGPQSATISDATPGAAIYLTMDGTTPTSASPGYNGPINVSGTVTVQAIAIAPGYLQSTAVSAAYTITSPPAAVMSTAAGSGVFGFQGTGGPATSAEFGFPAGVAFDSAGNMYIADTNDLVVWMVAANTGLITVVAGNGTAGYSGDGSLATNAQLNYPYGIASDPAGNLYIADFNNHVVRRVDKTTGLISTFAGNGQNGGTGDNGPATTAEMNGPFSVALDSALNVYVADYNNNNVREILKSNGNITTVAGNGGYTDSGDGGLATNAGIENPDAVAIDGTGKLYIADYGGRVRKVTAGIITTVAGNGDYGNSGDGGPATSAEIAPWGLAFDTYNNLYIASDPGAIRMVSAATGNISTVAGAGFCGYSGDGGAAMVAEICNPNQIAFDAKGSLYIADSNNYRVRKVAFALEPPPVGSLEAAIDSKTGSSTIPQADSLLVAGWVADPTDGSPLSNVKVYIDGTSIGTPTLDLPRPDVAAAYNNAAYTNSGYQLVYSVASLTPGTHAVTVVAIDSGGRSTTLGPLTITVTGGSPAGSLEAAIDSKTGSSTIPQTDSLLVAGWVADPTDGSPLSNVKVYIDGTSIGTPTLGLARPDVAAAYGKTAYTNSGYQLVYSVASLSPGTHAVTVVAIDSGGRSTTLGPLTITVTGGSPVGSLEAAIDSKTGSSTIPQTDSLLVAGWVADPTDGAPLSNVKVYIDGTSIGTPTLGLARPDVAAAYGKTAYTNSGYQLVYSVASLSPGTHAVTVVAIDSGGRSTTLGPLTITVTGGPPVGSLEAAIDSKTGSSTIPQADSLLVAGWVADPTDGAPLSNVKVYIDGTSIGTPTLGLARADVAAAYGKPAYTNSGYQLLYSVASLSPGTHAVTVVAIDSGGRSTTLGPLTITVTGGSPVGSLEAAIDSKNGSSTIPQTDSLLVAGWVADPTDGSPLSNVKVYIDGTSIGTPTLGLARPDVAAAYGKTAYTNSGYQLVYSVASLSPGTHAVTVVAIDSGGRSTTLGPLTITVTGGPPVGSLEAAIDSKTGSSTIPQADSLLVAGWVADPTDGAPLSNVKVYIDGTSIGTPTLGLPRPDVAAAYGKTAYTNSGYQLLYSVATLTPGTHAVTVVAIDSGGRSTTFGPLTITVP